MVASKDNRTRLLVQLGLLALIVVVIRIRLHANRAFEDLLGFFVFAIVACIVAAYSVRVFIARLQASTHSRTGHILRAKPQGYLYIGVVFSVCGALLMCWVSLFSIVRDRFQFPQFWPPLFFGIFGFGFLCSWFGAHQLRISPLIIEYWSLFGGYRSLKREKIRNAQIRIGYSNTTNTFWPAIRLQIQPMNPQAEKPVVVNLKVFRREDIREVIGWLGDLMEHPSDLALRVLRMPHG